MAEDNKLKLTLEADVLLKKGRIDTKFLEQAIATSLRSLGVKQKTIEQQIGVKPTFNRAQVRSALDGAIKELDEIISRAPGSKGALTSTKKALATSVRDSLTDVLATVSQTVSLPKGVGTSKLVQSILEDAQKGVTDIDKLNKLSAKGFNDLQTIASRYKSASQLYSKVVASGLSIGKKAEGAPLTATGRVDSTSGRPSSLLAPPQFLDSVTTATRHLTGMSKALEKISNPDYVAKLIRDREEASIKAQQKRQEAYNEAIRKQGQKQLEDRAKFFQKEQKELAKSLEEDRKAAQRQAVQERKDAEAQRKKNAAYEEKFRRQEAANKTLRTLPTDRGVLQPTGQLDAFLKSPAAANSLLAGLKDRQKALSDEYTKRLSQLSPEQAKSDTILKGLNRRYEQTVANIAAVNNGLSRLSGVTKQAADAEARRQREKLQLEIAQARLNYGNNLIAQSGGLKGVAQISNPEDQLLARDALLNRLNKLRDRQDSYIRAGDTKSSGFKATRQELLETGRAIDDLQGKMRGFSTVAGQAGATLRQFLRYAVGYGALYQALGAVTALTRGLVDLDAEMKSIKAISAATDAEMVKVEASIKSVALTTKFTSTEVAKAARVLAQSGVKPDEINEALAATANFAAATQSSIEVASDLVSTMRNVYKDLTDSTIANQLTSAINTSKLVSEDLKVILSISAQTAQSYGLSSEQFLAAITTLRNAGLKASTVATGLRQGLIELFSPDSKTIKILKTRYRQLGEDISEAAIRARFLNLQNEDNPLLSVLREFERLGFNGEAKGLFQRSFDIRAENAIKALIANIDDLEKAESRLTLGNSAIIGSQIQLTSLQATIDNLAAAFTVLADSIAGDGVEGLQKFLSKVVEVTREVTQLNDELKASGGSGIGTAALLGLGVGTGVASKVKGGFLRKTGFGALAGVASAAAATPTLSAIGRSGIDVNAIVNAVLTTAAIGGLLRSAKNAVVGAVEARRVSSAASRTPVYTSVRAIDPDKKGRLITKNPTPLEGVTKGKKGGLSSLAGDALGFILGGTALLDILSSLYQKLSGSKAFQFLLKGARAFSPVGWASLIIGLVTLFRGLDDASKNEQVKKRLRQRQENFVRDNQDFLAVQQEAADFTLSTPQKAAEKGTGAAELENLEKKLEALNERTKDVLGQTSDTISEALLTLSRDGSEALSNSRRRALKELSKALGGEQGDASINALLDAGGALNSDQANLDRTLSQLANEYSNVKELTNGLGEAMNLSYERLADLGDQATLAQAALRDAYAELSPSQIAQITGEVAVLPGQVNGLLRRVMQRAREILNEGYEVTLESRQDKLKSEIRQLAEDVNNLDNLDFKQTLANYAAEANKLGVSTSDFIKLMAAELKRAQGFARSAAGNPTFFKSRDEIEAGFNENTPFIRKYREANQTLDLFDLNRLGEEAQVRSATLTKANNRIDDIKAYAYSPSADKLLESNAITPEQLARARAIADRYKGKDTTDERGLTVDTDGNINDRELFAKSMDDAVELFKTQYASDRDLADRIKQATKELVIQNQKAKATRELDERKGVLERELAEADRLGELDKLPKIRKELNDIEQDRLELAIKTLRAEQGAATGEDAYAKRFQLQIEIDNTTAQLAELKKKQAYEEEEFLRALAERRYRLERENAELDLKLKEAQPPAGRTAAEQAYYDVSGLSNTSAEKRLRTQTDLGIAQDRADDVVNQIGDVRSQYDNGLISLDEANSRVKELVLSYKELNAEIARYNEELNRTDPDYNNQLSIGFNFSEIGQRIQDIDGGFSTLGQTIQDQVVSGVNDLVNGLGRAIIEGENLGEVFRNVLGNLASGIAQAIQTRAINNFVGELFNSGGSSGGGYASIFSAFSKLFLFSDGVANIQGYADGAGKIRGPGTGTSDSIPAIHTDKNGKFLRPIMVANGESILTAKATDILGEDFINRLNAGDFKGFSGGVVSLQSKILTKTAKTAVEKMNAGDQGSQVTEVAAPVIDFTSVNVVDESMFDQYATGPRGKRTYLNFIKQNATAIKRILS